jgi:hypothetical protein
MPTPGRVYWFSENGKFAFGALAMRDKDTR